MFALLIFFSSMAQARVVDKVVCFSEENSAKNAMNTINRHYDQYEQAMKQFKRPIHRPIQRPSIYLVNDTKDSFGRSNCLIITGKLNDREHKIMAEEQKREDLLALEKKRAEAKEKDPWGGTPLDLSGKPKTYRSCKMDENKKESDFECFDLIVTAMKGQEDVIEYRFWLGSQNGEGLAVYKSPGNALELRKVISQIRKDKEHFKWSFAPKDDSGALLQENAEIEAK